MNYALGHFLLVFGWSVITALARCSWIRPMGAVGACVFGLIKKSGDGARHARHCRLSEQR